MERFATGIKVRHKKTKAVGIVQEKFPGPGWAYEPWEVPVIWKGQKEVSVVNEDNLEIICKKCGGDGRKYVVDRVVQGQDYGPETEGHYESCPQCGGSGVLLPRKEVRNAVYK